MSHRRRALRPPRTRPLGPRDPVEPDCPPAHPLHTAGDARHAGAVRGRPRGAAPGARHGRRRASARPPGDRARDRARVGARGRGLPAGRAGAAHPRVRERDGAGELDRRPRPPSPRPGARAGGRFRRSARDGRERRRALPREPSGAARALARRDVRRPRRRRRAGPDAARTARGQVSGRAGAARDALPPRNVGRGARPARARGADLPRPPRSGTGERLRRRRRRPARGARGGGRGCGTAHDRGADRSRRAVAARRRAGDRDHRDR